jgi:excisionase family DNA binding protein
MMPNLPAGDAFCTSREAAKLLDVSVKTAQLWAESGILQAWKTPGGHRRISRKSVDELLSQRQRAIHLAAAAGVTDDPVLLIVEDDHRARRLYEMTVTRWGLPVQLHIACDGFEALLRIGERRPGILVTDLNMPGMDGFRLIAALRGDERYQSTQIVVVSGMTPAQIRDGGGLPDNVTVLSKPIPFSDLRKIIENHLLN